MADEALLKSIRLYPILFIDEIIEKKIKTGKSSKLQLFKVIQIAVLAFLGLEEDQTNLDSFFQTNNKTNSENEFISIILLRILCKDKYFFLYEKGEEHKVLKFLFEVLKDNNLYKLSTRDQNYQIKNKLIENFQKQESQIISDIPIITDISEYPTFKSSIRKILFSKNNKQIINYFVDQNIYSDNSISTLINFVDIYIKNQSFDKIKAFEKAIAKSEEIIEKSLEKTAGNYFTFYSREIIGKPIQALKNILENDFENCPFAQKADISIQPIEKKYPLSLPNQNFKITLNVINKSEGFPDWLKIEFESLDSRLKVLNKKLEFNLLKTQSMVVNFDAFLVEFASRIKYRIHLEWYNYDNTKENKSLQFTLHGQETEVDWKQLGESNPYSLEYIDEEKDLYGRKDIIDRIYVSTTNGNSVSSFYIFGQKRVGKTSIAKVVQSKILKNIKNDFGIVYLETGEYQTTNNNISDTINNLVSKICRKIRKLSPEFSNVEIPTLNGSFSNINDFLDDIIDIIPTYKILIILDEFDEIHPQLYSRSEVGNSFFLSIRSISNKRNFGFLLVGGEKIDLVIDNQGDKINKFSPIRIDSFDKEFEYSSFVDMVKDPAKEINFEDESIELLYDYTNGNPFYSKIILKKLFENSIKKRDLHVTQFEMIDAIDKAMKEDGVNSFMHFWEDGINQVEEKHEEISILRRKLLLSIADLILTKETVEINYIIEEFKEEMYTKQSVRTLINEYVNRNILFKKDGMIFFQIKYFKEWLIKYGIHKILTTLPSQELINEKRKREEKARISPKEVIEITSKWKSYQGVQITPDLVRSWLNQFGNHTDQRLVFQILKHLKFYDDFFIREKMEEVFKRIRKEYLNSLKEIKEGITGAQINNRFRKNILISYLDGVGKSGAEYAKLFGDQNRVPGYNIVETNKIIENLKNKKGIHHLIFVDDIIGTGRSLKNNFQKFIDANPSVIESGIKIYIGVIAGFMDAKNSIEEDLASKGININILIGDPLSDSEKCFGENSRYFQNQTEKENCMEICLEKGLEIVRSNPLGFGDCQLALVFSKTCPNNSLPILWKKAEKWTPLFERIIS